MEAGGHSIGKPDEKYPLKFLISHWAYRIGVATAIAGFFPAYFYPPSSVIQILFVWSLVGTIVLPFYYIAENEIMRRLRRRGIVRSSLGALRRNLIVDAVFLGINILFLFLSPVLSLYLSWGT